MKLKQSLNISHSKMMASQTEFIDDLPHVLKMELSIYLYEDMHKSVRFLRKKTQVFISWICPLLKPTILTENEYVYFEGDTVGCIYFLREGNCGFVLPKHSNAKYINIEKRSHFGLIDIVGYICESENQADLENWIT